MERIEKLTVESIIDAFFKSLPFIVAGIAWGTRLEIKLQRLEDKMVTVTTLEAKLDQLIQLQHESSINLARMEEQLKNLYKKTS